MNSISISEAIASGVWYDCTAFCFEEQMTFRLRALGFERTTVAEIEPRLSPPVAVEGVLWLLSVEVVNLDKAPIRASNVADAFSLTDVDGCEFPRFYNGGLSLNPRSVLHRFSGWSGNPPLSPKIKATGSIAFVLPDEENSYRLTLKKGSIKEA